MSTSETTATADAPAAESRPPTRRRSRWWGLLAPVLLLALLLGGTGSGLWWALRSDAGTAWLLTKVPGLQIAAPRGALLRDFEAERIEFTLPANGGRVVATGFGWRGLQLTELRWRAGPAGWVRVAIDDLHARRVDLLLTPADPPRPLTAPTSLRLPLQLTVQALRIGELHAAALGEEPLRGIEAQLTLGAEGGSLHRADGLAATWGALAARASARIATDAPFALQVDASAGQGTAPAAPAASASAALPAASSAAAAPASAASAPAAPGTASWHATAALSGPLAEPTLVATVRGRLAATRPEQTLDARAVLRPFAAWPLGDLRIDARDFDLAAFGSGAPATALSGSASARTQGLDQPAVVTLALANARAGLWNEGLLPLRRLDAELRARPDDRRVLELQRADAELGTARDSAGRLQASGRWTPERVQLDVRLSAVQPARLDARAPAMPLSGTMAAVLTGLQAGAAGGPKLELRADLAGSLARAIAAVGAGTAAASAAKPPSATGARDARLQLDLTASGQQVDIRQALATLGAAQASLKGSASRASARAPWQARGEARLVEFDPLPWWPGRDDAPLRLGPHRLNATATLDLAWQPPAGTGGTEAGNTAPTKNGPAAAATPLGWLQALSGTARLGVERSLLAGVPLSGQARAQRSAGGAAQFTLQADLAGNRVDANGQLATSAAADTLELQLAAPDLERLAPLWRLLAPPGTTATLAGAITGQASVRGRWPAVTSNGQLDARSLRIGLPGPGRGGATPALRADAVQARWQLGSAATARADVQVDAAGLSMPAANGSAGPSIESLQARLEGTAAAHTLRVKADTKALPPAWFDNLQPASANTASSASTRSVASLQLEGSLAAAGWRGTLKALEAGRGDVGKGTAKDGVSAPWLRTENIAVDAQWGAGPLRVVVQPGRVEALGATLRFDRIAWQAAVPGGSPATLDAQAQLDALPVAPLLARAQPDFGWGGDLAVAGRLSVKSAPTFSADIVLERARGDLTVTDETGTQALGLSDLRLGLNAQNGVWSFTQGLAGRTLGVAAGAVVARTSPTATWPAADTPVEGVLELQVANLGTWGTWVPAGWRLGGALRTSATIGGRFGAPEYTGQVLGSGLSVRNFVQGVNVSDGDVAITLAGATARIERFSFQAGGGTLSLSGDASLGDAPLAALTLRAERFQLLGRVDRRIVTSGEARLKLTRGAVALDGRFGIDEGLFDFTRSDAPSLASDVVVLRSPTPAIRPSAAASAAAAADAAPASPASRVALDLVVDLGQKLRVRGRGLDTGLRGELKLTSPGNRFTVNGSITTADGTYNAYGQKLAIDRGVISFAGNAANPRLDIEATRPNLDTRVGVRITGSTVDPRIRLFSEPELSELDKLSWLVLGRASDGLGRTDTALLQRAAVALLAGEGEGVTGQLTRAIGLDDVSLRQTDGEVRETVISLGKQLSRRWYVGYERGLNATTGTWQLVYRIAQRFTLRAQSGLDNSLDLIWTWRWQ